MGEVYRARDTRLDRTVAIKVLPAALAADVQFRERFDREAKAISQLDHPHICALYDVGEGDGTAYLVMQHLEGETLAARVERGPLPTADALRIGIEIGGALDAAHRAGIVHRDLKPGNVMMTKAGAKLLDFGLAKTGVPPMSGAGVSMMPTTPQNITAQGTILGTFQYMAPEQLEGLESDSRTDIFAFGALLYEMLTGRKAFAAKSHAGLISAIMSVAPPPVSAVHSTTPPAVDRLIARCLAKDPDARWQSAADLVFELRSIVDDLDRPTAPSSSSVRSSRPVSRATPYGWIAATAVFAIAASVLAVIAMRRPASPPPVTRFDVLPQSRQHFGTPPGLMSLSPDGRRIAYFTQGNPGAILWIHSFDTGTAKSIPGTENGWHPFWSPDGRSIGFVVGSRLKRVDIDGGAPRTLADTNGERGAWSSKDVILFTGADGRLYQIPAAGGEARAVTELDKQREESAHAWPLFLHDGKRFIYSARSSKASERALYLASLDAPGRTRLVDAFSSVELGPGYLLYVTKGTLVAQPFDEKVGRFAGDAVPLAENIDFNPSNGRAAASASATGVLAFRSAGTSAGKLVWVDRSGRLVDTIGTVTPPTATVGNWPRLSPDGKQAALVQTDVQRNDDVWQIDLSRKIPLRFTFDAAAENSPVWSPDGRWIAFSSTRRGHADIYRKASGGVGTEELLFESAADKTPTDWSPDGNVLLFTSAAGTSADARNSDVFALPLEGDRKPYPVIHSSAEDELARFSPDGRWILYESEESGSDHVYVQPFPPTGAKWQLSSVTGGFSPRWSPDGKEIFFLDGNWHVTSVAVQTIAGRLEPAVPRDLFQATIVGAVFAFDVSRDGQRFLVVSKTEDAIDAPLTVMLNWTAALKK